MPPRRVIIVVLTLLGLLHLYIGLRLLPAMGLGSGALAAAIAVLLLSIVLLPASLLAQGLQRLPWADQLAWAGFLAMGLFSSVLVLTLLRDAALVLLSIGGWASAALVRQSAQAVPLLSIAITLVGLVNARRVASVVDVDVPIAGLPAALAGYTIVQISDIHVGPTIKRHYIDAIVDRVNSLAPDAIAITGDVVDGSVQRLSRHTAPLARLHARDGSFVVTGNHEYYSNAVDWIAEFRRLGLTVLMNEHVLRERSGARFMIAGVTDYSAHHFHESHRSDPTQASAGAPAGFDLQLSGHTHGGQFFPWNLFVPLQQPYTAGLHRLRDLWVYTSRGTGYWGPPKRFGAPSEITRLRLVAA
jgi:uncharacterized protein